MKKYLLSFAFLLLTLPVLAEDPCGGSTGSSEPSSPSAPSSPSTPSTPAGASEGGSTADQMGQSFDPQGENRGDRALQDFLKTHSKDSKDLKEIKKLEQQVKKDKQDTHQVKDKATDALRDLSKTRGRIAELEAKLENTNSYGERRQLIQELKEAVRKDAMAEQRAEEIQQKFTDSVNKFGDSLDRYNDAVSRIENRSADAQNAPTPVK